MSEGVPDSFLTSCVQCRWNFQSGLDTQCARVGVYGPHRGIGQRAGP